MVHCSNCHQEGHNIQRCPHHQVTSNKCRCISCRPNRLLFVENDKLVKLSKSKTKELCQEYKIDTTDKSKIDMIECIIDFRDQTKVIVENFTNEKSSSLFSYIINEVKNINTNYDLINRVKIYTQFKKKTDVYDKNELLHIMRFLSLINGDNQHPIISILNDKINIDENLDKLNTDINTIISNFNSTSPSTVHIWQSSISSGLSNSIRTCLKTQIYTKFKKIILKVFKIKEEQFNSSVERKSTRITNETNNSLDVYWYFRRPDAPDYSECKKMETIMSKKQSKLWRINKNIHIIIININSDNYYLNKNEYYINLKPFITEEYDYEQIIRNIFIRDELSQWKESTLKMDFILKELKRLGIEDNDTLASIIDLHQDINIPSHNEFDKDNAGIPSSLTNIT